MGDSKKIHCCGISLFSSSRRREGSKADSRKGPDLTPEQGNHLNQIHTSTSHSQVTTSRPVLPPPIVLEPPQVSLPLGSPPPGTVINAEVSGSQKTAVCDPQSTPLTSRPEHLNRLMEILRSELKEEEYKAIAPRTTSPDTVKNIIDLAIGIFEKKVEALGAQKGRRKKIDQLLRGLKSVAKLGGPAIRNHPDVFAFLWVGVQFFLQVAVTHREGRQIVETAMGDIISALGVCGCYDAIYISSAAEETAKLGEALTELYASIIIFCMNSKGYLECCNIEASFKGALTDANGALRSLLEDMKRKAKVVRQFANLAKAEDDKRRLEELRLIATDTQEGIIEVKESVSRIEKAQELALSDQQRKIFRKSRIWLGGLEGDSENDRNQKLHTVMISSRISWHCRNRQ